MRMLIIRYESFNTIPHEPSHSLPQRAAGGFPRACVIGYGTQWLNKNIEIQRSIAYAKWQHATKDIISDEYRTRDSPWISQSGEILYDPLELIDKPDEWLADYHFASDILLSFKLDNVIELRLNNNGIWVQTPLTTTIRFPEGVLTQDPWEGMAHIFSSSYGGDGIQLPMRLNEKGKRVLCIKREKNNG